MLVAVPFVWMWTASLTGQRECVGARDARRKENMDDPEITITFGEDGKTCQAEFQGSPPKAWVLAKALRDQADDIVRMATENRIQYTRDTERLIFESLERRGGSVNKNMAP